VPGFNGNDIERIDRADISDSRKVPGRRVRNVNSSVPAKRFERRRDMGKKDVGYPRESQWCQCERESLSFIATLESEMR